MNLRNDGMPNLLPKEQIPTPGSGFWRFADTLTG